MNSENKYLRSKTKPEKPTYQIPRTPHQFKWMLVSLPVIFHGAGWWCILLLFSETGEHYTNLIKSDKSILNLERWNLQWLSWAMTAGCAKDSIVDQTLLLWMTVPTLVLLLLLADPAIFSFVWVLHPCVYRNTNTTCY